MTGQGDQRFGSSSSGWGLHLLSWVGAATPPTGGGPTGSAMSGSVRLAGDDPSSAVGLAHSPSRRLPPPTPLSGFGTPCLGPSPLATWRSGDLLLSPSSPPMRCPGAVPPPRRLARGSVRPRPASSPEEWILRQPSGSLAMPRSEDRLAARLPSFRRRGLGEPPSTPTKTWRSRNLVCRQGRENGESGGGERGGGSAVLSCVMGAENRPLDVLVSVSPGDVRDRRSAAMCGAEAGEEFDLRLARRALGRLAPRHDEVSEPSANLLKTRLVTRGRAAGQVSVR
jgi:hypothetical protein